MHSSPFCPLHASSSTAKKDPPAATTKTATAKEADAVAVVRASTYVLWEQLYSASALPLTLERLMYVRLMGDQETVSSADGRRPTAATATAPAPLWVSGLFSRSDAPVNAPTSVLPGANMNARCTHDAPPQPREVPQLSHQSGVFALAPTASPAAVSTPSTPRTAVPQKQQHTASVSEQGQEREIVEDGQQVLRRVSTHLPSSPVRQEGVPTADTISVGRAATASVLRGFAASVCDNEERGSGGCGSIVLRPQPTDNYHRHMARSASPVEASVSSPPDCILPTSMSALASPLVPPQRHTDVATPEPSMDSSVNATTVTLVSEALWDSLDVSTWHDDAQHRRHTPLGTEGEKQTLERVALLVAEEVKDEEEGSEMAPDRDAVRPCTPPRTRKSETRCHTANENASWSTPQPTSPFSRATISEEQVNEEEYGNDADGVVSLPTSPAQERARHDAAQPSPPPAATPSPGPTVNLIDTLTAIPKAAAAHASLFACAHNCPSEMSFHSASPLADKDGLVFSPPRQHQMHLRLHGRRRPRAASEGDVSSTGSISPRSPPQPAFDPSRSASATPHPMGEAVEVQSGARATATDRGDLHPLHKDHDEEAVCPQAIPVSCAFPLLVATCIEPPHAPEEEATTPGTETGGTVVELPCMVSLLPPPSPSPSPLQQQQQQQHVSPAAVSQDENAEKHDAEAGRETLSHRDVQLEDERVVEEEEEHRMHATHDEMLAAADATPPTHSADLRSPVQRSVSSSGCGLGSSTPGKVRYTAAVVATVHDTPQGSRGAHADRSPVFVKECGIDDAEASHRSPAPSVSPAPRRVSATLADDAAHIACNPPTRPSVSTLDFTWATEAEGLLRRQQQRLLSRSVAQGGRSPSVNSNGHPESNVADADLAAEAARGQIMGPHMHRPLPESSIGVRYVSASRDNVGKQASASPTWSVSPQPQDPHVRFCTPTTTTVTTTAATPPPPSAAVSACGRRGAGVPQRPRRDATSGDTSCEGFASPRRVMVAFSPSQRSESTSASPTSPPPPQQQQQQRQRQLDRLVAGAKRPRTLLSSYAASADGPVGVHGKAFSAFTEVSGSTMLSSCDVLCRGESVSRSPPPRLANTRKEDATAIASPSERVRRTRRADRAGPLPHPTLNSNNSGQGGMATMRRCRARLNASSATAVTAANEFVLPRTVSTEPATSLSLARAASPLQPRSVNSLQHHATHSPLPAKTALLRSARRRHKGKKASHAEGKAASSGGSAIPHQKPSMMALNSKLREQQHQLNNVDKEN